MTRSPGSWIGRPVRRREDPKYLRGEATYVADITLPRMAHLAVVRSPHGHAALGSIDATRSLAMRGVVGIFTSTDLAGRVRPLDRKSVV